MPEEKCELCKTACFSPVIFGSTNGTSAEQACDTTVGSAKKETTTYLHIYPFRYGVSVPKAQEEVHSGCLVGIK